MENQPIPYEHDAELSIIEADLAVWQVDETNAVETVGRTREDRLSDIRHAREIRRELIIAGFTEIEAAMRSPGKSDFFATITSSRKMDFWTTERRRKDYVERYEERAQTEIEELLVTLNLEDPADQAILLEKLNQEYALLKTRLIVVEMETRRLLHMFYDHFVGSGKSEEKRREEIHGRLSERGADAAEIVLLEIDTLRRQGLEDGAIYRQLQRKYHPDVSDHEKSEQITKLLNAVYDNKQKRFLI